MQWISAMDKPMDKRSGTTSQQMQWISAAEQPMDKRSGTTSQ